MKNTRTGTSAGPPGCRISNQATAVAQANEIIQFFPAVPLKPLQNSAITIGTTTNPR